MLAVFLISVLIAFYFAVPTSQGLGWGLPDRQYIGIISPEWIDDRGDWVLPSLSRPHVRARLARRPELLSDVLWMMQDGGLPSRVPGVSVLAKGNWITIEDDVPRGQVALIPMPEQPPAGGKPWETIDIVSKTPMKRKTPARDARGRFVRSS